ncbi:MAG: hypothetical protein JSV36_16045 [Anaerolineae bacterium]|nr:MAG: hypothetical protein JSV36_16045 [Anaerolineae bacterium]
MTVAIEEFMEMTSSACDGCPFQQEEGCYVPYKVCWKRPIGGTDFTVKDVVTAVVSWICDPLELGKK